MRWIVRLAAVLVVLTLFVVVVVRVRYGGGQPYPDVTGPPILPDAALETVVSFGQPIGNVAVSADGRLFFTVHPESRPTGPVLWEWRDAEAVPFPAADLQQSLFDTPLGVVVDRQNRLWTVDHGSHGFGSPRVVALDLGTGEAVVDHRLGPDVAPRGSFVQDLQVAPDGRTVYLADVSFWRQQPALAVLDVASGTARRVLEDHPSVVAQDWIIHTPAKRMVFFGGLAAMKPGVDGIAVSTDGGWLAYGAMSHDTLYRVPTAALRDASLTVDAVARQVEDLGRKPLSDGLSADVAGGIWITDVEHGAVVRRGPARDLGEDAAYPLGGRAELRPRRLAVRRRLGDSRAGDAVEGAHPIRGALRRLPVPVRHLRRARSVAAARTGGATLRAGSRTGARPLGRRRPDRAVP